jgi:uncharacterized protein YdhG (YjbR/CyaY superfamily)
MGKPADTKPGEAHRVAADEAVQRYVDGIDPDHRPLFDRVHRLILEARPEASVSLSYGMTTYKVGKRRLYLGAWRHGVSIYGWRQGGDGGFTDRHPELRSGKGTIRLRTEQAAAIPDAELRDMIGAALNA